MSCHGHAGQQLQRQKAPCSVTSDKDIDTQNKNVYRYDYTDTWLPLDGDYDSSNAVSMIERALAAGEEDDPHGTISTGSTGIGGGGTSCSLGTEASGASGESSSGAVATLAVHTKAFRHGVPNDVRDLWRETATSLEPFHENDDAASLRLRELLARHKLIAATDVRNVASRCVYMRIYIYLHVSLSRTLTLTSPPLPPPLYYYHHSGAGVKRSKKDEAKERRKRRNKVAPSAFNTHLAGGQLERSLAEAGGDD